MVPRASRSVSGHGHPVLCVITLAGKNNGAFMKFGGGGNSKKVKEHQGGRIDGGAFDGKPGGHRKKGMMPDQQQCAGDQQSLLQQSSCSDNELGVYLRLSVKSTTKDMQKDTADKAAAANKRAQSPAHRPVGQRKRLAGRFTHFLRNDRGTDK